MTSSTAVGQAAETVGPPGDAAVADGLGALDTAALAEAVAAHPHGRVPRPLRRALVLAVANDLFTERGYQHVSMDEVARRAGVSKPVVYDLVGSKDQLFQDLMAQVADELARRIEAAAVAEPDPVKRLDAGVQAFFRFVGERRDAWISLLRSDAAPISKEVAAIRARQHRLVISLMTDAARELGAEPDPLWVEAAAHAINGASEALAIWWADHDELTADDVAALVTFLFAPGLDALGTPGGSA